MSLSGTGLGESGTKLGSGVLQSGAQPLGGPPGSISGSGSTFRDFASGSGPVPLQRPAAGAAGGKWVVAAAGVVVLAGLSVAGWWAFGKLNASPTPPHTEPHPVAGLPEAHPPVKVVTAKERVLLAKWENPTARPADVLDAGIELGLLYVKDHRLDDAERVFNAVEVKHIDWTAEVAREKWADWTSDLPKKLDGNPLKRFIENLSDVPGKLGRAVVLAHRDRAAESVDLFAAVVTELEKKPFAKAKPKLTFAEMLLVEFLKHHPDFAQAVATAMKRNETNLKGKVPEKLEWLRTPEGIARGPK